MSRACERRYRRAGLLLALGTVLTGLLLSGLPAALALDPDQRISQYAHTAWRVRDGTFAGAPSAITQTTDGYVWIGTVAGLLRFDGVRFVPFVPPAGKHLPNPAVISLLGATDGSLWIGTDNGLAQWKNGELVNFPEIAGRVNSIYEDRPRNGLSGDRITSLFEDHAGRLWVGLDNGLFLYEHGRFTPIHHPDGSLLGIVLAMTEDKDNNVWAAVIRNPPGRPTKLICFRDGRFVKEISDQRLDVSSLAADPQGGFWLGLLRGGLARYRNNQVQIFPFKDGSARVNQVLSNSNGSVLAATNHGLVEQRGDNQHTLDKNNGLPCNRVYGLVTDKRSDLWLYAECGLIEIKSDEVQRWHDHPDQKVNFELFDAFDGAQPYIPPFSPAATRSNDGRLWFANDTVAQMIDPDGVLRNPIPPPVHIEDVIADRKTYSTQSGLRLPALTRDLEIDYTALSFVVPQKVHFRYKLEGYDRDWHDAGSRRQAFYSNLPPRSYTFRVKACNNSGVWNEAGASVDFFVAPAYYQTNWFRFFCVAAFIALLLTLHRWRVHQLKSQEKRLRDVVETIPAMTFTALADGSNTFVNKRWTEYTGLSVEQSAGACWQRAIHPEDLLRHYEKGRISVATGQLFEDEARFRRAADGEYRWFLVRCVPLRDRHGKIVKWYGTLTDIEDRKRAEQEREKLRELEADLAHINRVSMMGEMAASLAHEIKQPITAAITSAHSCVEWLTHEPPNLDRARAAASKIDKYGNRAAEIIDGIRSFYRKCPPHREWVDVNGIIREILTLLYAEATRSSVAVRTELAADLSEIKADHVQLQQVFMNLMLNAIEAMKDSGGELTVKSQREQDGQLLFSVSDTGPGLPAGKVDQIFSAFFTTKPQGSGMGLAISRSIVESHGGRLWATANDGHGATFHFSLPTHVTESALVI